MAPRHGSAIHDARCGGGAGLPRCCCHRSRRQASATPSTPRVCPMRLVARIRRGRGAHRPGTPRVCWRRCCPRRVRCGPRACAPRAAPGFAGAFVRGHAGASGEGRAWAVRVASAADARALSRVLRRAVAARVGVRTVPAAPIAGVPDALRVTWIDAGGATRVVAIAPLGPWLYGVEAAAVAGAPAPDAATLDAAVVRLLARQPDQPPRAGRRPRRWRSMTPWSPRSPAPARRRAAAACGRPGSARGGPGGPPLGQTWRSPPSRARRSRSCSDAAPTVRGGGSGMWAARDVPGYRRRPGWSGSGGHLSRGRVGGRTPRGRRPRRCRVAVRRHRHVGVGEVPRSGGEPASSDGPPSPACAPSS